MALKETCYTTQIAVRNKLFRPYPKVVSEVSHENLTIQQAEINEAMPLNLKIACMARYGFPVSCRGKQNV